MPESEKQKKLRLIDECKAHWRLRADEDEEENDKRDNASCALCGEYDPDRHGNCWDCLWRRVRGRACHRGDESYRRWACMRGQYKRSPWAFLSPSHRAQCCRLAEEVIATLDELRAAVERGEV